MKDFLKKFEKLKALKNPSLIGYGISVVFLFTALHYLSASRSLNNQLDGLNTEIRQGKSETARIQSELDLIVQKATEMEQQVAAANEKLGLEQAKTVELESSNKKLSDFASVLDSPKLKFISLITSDPESKAHGKFFWVPNLKTASVLVAGLKPNADTSEYQLWMVQQGAVNLNLMSFTVDSLEPRTFSLKDLPISDPKKLSSILITREPKGGSSRPSGTRVLSGKL